MLEPEDILKLTEKHQENAKNNQINHKFYQKRAIMWYNAPFN